MNFPRIYIDEPLPTGYSGSVKVLANMTSKELATWFSANLGTPGCAACAEGRKEAIYCSTCTAARQTFGEMASLIYGPALLGQDVSTPEKALAFFDNDDALPSEIVSWLFVLPDSIRVRRTEAIRKNARSSSAEIASS